jgi:hypothetical protein
MTWAAYKTCKAHTPDTMAPYRSRGLRSQGVLISSKRYEKRS